LREKDTLIQDNLIRFSTYLQQQEQIKKRDEELAKVEEIVKNLCFGNRFRKKMKS
jgi:hypothetical protein